MKDFQVISYSLKNKLEGFMKANIILLFFLILLSISKIYCQTSEYGNLKVYTREPYLSSFGYYSASHQLPADMGRLDYHGISYTYDYDMSTIGNFVINDNAEFRITLDGIFKFAVGYGNKKFESDNNVFPYQNINYYLIDFDFFTFSLNPEFTFILQDGYAATIHFGVDIVNIGAKVGVLESDIKDLTKYSFGIINLVPLAFRPAAYFDFGRTGLGLGAYINMTNILGFRYNSADLYPDDKWGIKTFDNFFRRFEFQIIFTF
jgi:hypothetical protein